MLQTSKYVVAFRTHVWDDTIEKLYRHLETVVDASRWQVVILADETHGQLQTPADAVKISHDADLSRFGLPDVPKGRSVWRNGDYAMQPLVEGIEAPAYIIIENDTMVSGYKTFETITRFFDQGGQFVTARLTDLDEESIPVKNTALGVYDTYQSVFVWLWGATQEVARQLRQARAALAQNIEPADDRWPTDEVFLGHEVTHQHYKTLVLDRLPMIDTSRLDYRPPYSSLEASLYQGDKLSHPVVAQSQIFTKYAGKTNLLADNYRDISVGSNLYKDMMLSFVEGDNQAVYNNMVMQYYLSDRQALRNFADFASSHHLTYPEQLDFDNKALFSRITASSVITPSVRKSAWPEFAVEGNYDVDKYRYGGFASQVSDQPWVEIDFGREETINKIVLYHREGLFERTKDLELRFSDGGTVELKDVSFSKHPDKRNRQGYVYSYQVDLPPTHTRTLRITNLGKNVIFNLNQIEVF